MPKVERCALMNNLKAGARLLRRYYFTVLCAAIVCVMIMPAVGMTQKIVATESSAYANFLLLYPKNPHTWEIVPDNAGALLNYSREDNIFSLSAHMLEPDTRYALLQHEASYPPGNGYIVASGISDSRGNVQLQGRWKRWKGKFWIVPLDDVKGQPHDAELAQLKNWNPERYLFEEREL